jgi:hypothetical protein
MFLYFFCDMVVYNDIKWRLYYLFLVSLTIFRNLKLCSLLDLNLIEKIVLICFISLIKICYAFSIQCNICRYFNFYKIVKGMLRTFILFKSGSYG